VEGESQRKSGREMNLMKTHKDVKANREETLRFFEAAAQLYRTGTKFRRAFRPETMLAMRHPRDS
jgi:hypothetical protein